MAKQNTVHTPPATNLLAELAANTYPGPAPEAPADPSAPKKRNRKPSPAGPLTVQVGMRFTEAQDAALDGVLRAAHWPSIATYLRGVACGAVAVESATIETLSLAMRG